MIELPKQYVQWELMLICTSQSRKIMEFSLNSTAPGNASITCSSDPTHVLITTIFGIIRITAGLPMNARLIWILLSDSALDMLNINLLILDIVQCLLLLVDVIIIHVFPHYLETTRTATVVFSILGCPQLMAFMCLERYVAVVWPTRYSLLKAYCFRELCCAVMWAGALSFTIAVFLSNNFGTFYIGSAFIVGSVGIMIFCNIKILRTLRSSSPGRDEMHPVKVKAYRTVRRIMGVVAFCYAPSVIIINVAPLLNFGRCNLIMAGLGLLTLATILNPIIMLYSKGKIMQCLVRAPRVS